MAIQFTLQLTDKVSSSTATITRNLTTVGERMKSVESSAKSLEKQMAKASALGDHTRVAKLSEQHNKLVTALDKSAGSQHGMTSSLAGFSAELGPAIAVVGVYALAIGGLVTALYEGGKLALAASAFKKETLASFTFLTGSAKVGRETLDTIRSLEGSVPEAEATLAERAKGLLTAGLDPSKLKSQLLTISNVAAVAGEEGATKLQNLQEKILTTGQFKFAGKALKGTGVTEADLAKQLGLPGPRALDAALKAGTISVDKGLDAMASVINKKFGGAAEEKVKTLSGLSNKLHDNIFRIFEDVKTGPFLDGLSGIVKLFDASSGSGQFFKWVVESIFNAGFAESGGILLSVKHGIQDIIIKSLELYIALKPTIARFKDLWAQAKKSEDLKSALKGIGVVVAVLAIGVGIIAGTLMLLGVATIAIVAGLALAVGWLSSKAFKFILSMPDRMKGWKAKALDYTTRFIEGIVEGISAGIAKVQKAAHELASVLPKGVADTLEIKSPSRVGIRQGRMYGEGVAIGAEGSRAGATTAAISLAANTAAATAPGRGGDSRQMVVNVMPGAVQIMGAGSNGEVLTLTEAALAALFEKIALKEGLGST